MYYGVFMNKNVKDKLHEKYDFILENLDKLWSEFQKYV